MTSPTFWTDAQWDEFNKRRVTVGLDFFDSITNAVEMLQRGRRLSKDDREQWATTAHHCREIMEKHEAEIGAM